MNRPLWEDARLILASLQGSTTHRAAEVAEFLAGKLGAAAKRSRWAIDESQARAEKRKARIVLAFGAMGELPELDAKRWGVDRIVRDRIERCPDKYGPEPAPSLEVIRSVRRSLTASTAAPLIETPRSVPNHAPLGFDRLYSRRMSSTTATT